MQIFNGSRPINYQVWEPEGSPRGLLQLSHGMAEHIRRYDDFARFMASHGWLVFGNDHIGHGDNAPTPEERGYMPRDGADILVEDLHLVADDVKSHYPDLPHVLLGHSMGSFVARHYLSRYGAELDGAIIMGSAGGGQPTAAGKLLARLTSALRGSHHRSPLIDSIAFGSYNKRLGKDAHKFAWLSRDDSVVAAYDADELCGYVFTADAFYVLFDLLGRVSAKSWPATVPTDLPLLIVSGEQDPVGNYGKGVTELYRSLLQAGCSGAALRLYPEDRHEILNELDRSVVYGDILGWCEGVINTQKEKESNND